MPPTLTLTLTPTPTLTVMILSFSEYTAGWFYNQYNYCCHVSTPIYYTNLLPTLDSNHSVTVQYYSWAIQHDVEWSSEPVHRVCYTLSLSVLNGGRHLVWRSTNLCRCKLVCWRGSSNCIDCKISLQYSLRRKGSLQFTSVSVSRNHSSDIILVMNTSSLSKLRDEPVWM